MPAVQYDDTSITPASPDFYNILEIDRNISLNDIKIAYRRTLLRHHPDKQPPHWQSCAHELALASSRSQAADMALVKEAYETLSDARLRAVYDQLLKKGELGARPQPRPAQVVSLEEFTAADVPVRSRGVEMVRGASRLPPGSEPGGPSPGIEELAEVSAVRQEWVHQCRCGGTYRITEDDLENGTHLVGCESCSEVVWVGYEVVTEDEEGGDTP